MDRDAMLAIIRSDVGPNYAQEGVFKISFDKETK